MRPDEHRRKKNENYKRKHNIQGKKSRGEDKNESGNNCIERHVE